jgi:hypothetical protein
MWNTVAQERWITPVQDNPRPDTALIAGTVEMRE